MSIEDYALELGVTCEEVIDSLKKMGYNYKSKSDILDDEAIIMLDNELSKVEENNLTEELADKFELEDRAEEAALAYNIELDEQVKVKEKFKKKDNKQNQEDLSLKKKNIYKNKQKLQSNKEEVENNVVLYKEGMSVSDLANELKVPVTDVVKKLIGMGLMISSNQAISFEDAEVLVLDYNKELVKEETTDITNFEEYVIKDNESDLVERPAVVTIMGHVDHGKTTLLDTIRKSAVVDGEFGGITQHIGAYQVEVNGKKVTFLDTPGHEAFTAMRARGAQVTDIVIIVVAADDGVMPQTKEAIDHAKAAGVPIVVAINKIDKDGANPERVKQMLVEYDLVPEEWGGDTVCVEISAKKRINIDGLLEMVLLVADMQELKANPNRDAQGTVIEAEIDKGRGPVATVLVQNGTLKVGDFVIAGTAVGRVRAMVNDKGRRVKTAPPSTPVEILGLSEAPSGGDTFMVVENEKLARDVAEQRKQELQENKFNQVVKVSLDNLFSQIDEGNMKELDVIIKADVQGSVEAVKQSLEKLSNDEVRVRAIHGGVGAINESDVMLANASNAIIVGFNVRPDAGALASAEQNEVDIRLYRVIYQAIEEIEAAMKGMLDPEFKEVVIGYAEVRQTFKVSNVGTIAGCYVTQGKIQRNAEIRIVRNGIIVHEGTINSLKRFKDDAKEVAENFECGIGVENFNDIKEGDTIECFVMEEIER